MESFGLSKAGTVVLSSPRMEACLVLSSMFKRPINGASTQLPIRVTLQMSLVTMLNVISTANALYQSKIKRLETTMDPVQSLTSTLSKLSM